MIGDVRWSSRRKNNNIILEGGYFESSSSLSLSLSRRIWWTRRRISMTVVLEREYDCSSDRISNIRVQISIDFDWYPIRSSTYLYKAMNVDARRSVILLIHSLTRREREEKMTFMLLVCFRMAQKKKKTRKKKKEKEKMKRERWRHANVLPRFFSPLLLFLSFSVNCLQMRWSSV